MRETPTQLTNAREIITNFKVVFLDIWGVLIDGQTKFHRAVEALKIFTEFGIQVVLISNTSRTASQVIHFLSSLGIEQDLYTGVVTGGDLALESIRKRTLNNRKFGSNAFILGTQAEGNWISETGLRIVSKIEDADVIISMGLLEQAQVSQKMLDMLRQASDQDVPLIVTNPDVKVRIGDTTHTGSGVLAPIYKNLGGATYLFGKPAVNIFQNAKLIAEKSRQLKSFANNEILTIGDSLKTDVLGGKKFGTATLLVTATGIHEVRSKENSSFNKNEIQPDYLIKELRW